MSLYPSRGLHLHGFEIKCSRSDLVNELKDASKADEIGQYCHFWWLVLADKKFAEGLEIPSNWGVQYVNNGGDNLKVLTVAKMNEFAKPPTHSLLAVILKQTAKKANSDEAIIRLKDKMHDEGYKKGLNKGYTDSEEQIQRLRDELNTIKRIIHRFKEETGMSFTEYNYENVIDAYKVIAELGLDNINIKDHLIWMLKETNKIKNGLENYLTDINSESKCL